MRRFEIFCRQARPIIGKSVHQATKKVVRIPPNSIRSETISSKKIRFA